MKKVIGVLLATTLLSGTAFARGAPAPAPAPVMQPCPAVTWGGFKVGAQLGYGHSANDFKQTSTTTTSLFGVPGTTTAVSRTSADLASDGVLGGVHAGYDYQFHPNWLVGIEAFFDFADLEGKVKTDNTIVLKAEMDWTVGAKARLGYVLNDSLFYGGIGWAGSRWKLTDSSFNTSKRKSDFINGLQLTLGAAQRFNRILLGLEGNYTFYESLKHTQTVNNVAVPGETASVVTQDKISPRVLDVKLKLSYML